MCGIAGIISLGEQPIDPTRVKRMCDTIAHRGPDDAGTAFFRPGTGAMGKGSAWCAFTDRAFRHHNEHLPVFGGPYCCDELSRGRFSVGLGHRRLSILDLSPYGHQPMASSDQRYWIIFNGEIYNFPALKSGLIDRGYAFRTGTDTEVILNLWEEHGVDCLTMLDGMFTFAIYDRMQNVLTLARDRFGVKPLYFAESDGFLIFASEAKAILASGHVKPAIDPAGLVEYFTFQNVLRRETIWERIEILEPGEYMEIRPGTGREPTPRRYHHAYPQIDLAATDESASAEAVADAFKAAVERQLISDVPVGSYLSGGMDSGSIVAVAGRSIPRLHTFTGGFDLTNVNGIEQGFDERRLAEQLSYLLQTEHYDVVLHAGDMPAAMDRICRGTWTTRVSACVTRTGTSRSSRASSSRCASRAPAATSSSPGYPWRYRIGLAAGDQATASTTATSTYWHRLFSPEELPNAVRAGPLRERWPARRARASTA